MAARSGETGRTPPGRIDRAYYDSTDYFEGRADHLRDLDSPFQRYRVRKVLDIHRPRPTDRVVDLGCGWGTFCFALAGTVERVVGVDFSERSVELCRRRLGRPPGDDVRFVRADAGDTGLEGGAWDLVIAADLFEHLYPDDSRRVVAEAFRLLRPGGRFSVWTPNPGHLLEHLKRRDLVLRRDPTHVDYKTLSRLRALLVGGGFEIERAYYAESHLPGLRVVERIAQRFVPPLRRRIAVLARRPGGEAGGGLISSGG